MKLFTLVVLVLLFPFNDTVAQNRKFSLKVGQKSKAAKDKYFLVLKENQKRLFTFNADLAKRSPRLELRVKEGTGSIKVQSLLQVVNEQLIQWQLTDKTKPGNKALAKGEIQLLKQVQ